MRTTDASAPNSTGQSETPAGSSGAWASCATDGSPGPVPTLPLPPPLPPPPAGGGLGGGRGGGGGGRFSGRPAGRRATGRWRWGRAPRGPARPRRTAAPSDNRKKEGEPQENEG